MKYGNCLFAALIFYWRFRHRSPKLVMRWPSGMLVPHIGVVVRGKVYHYRRERDFLPEPLCYLLFCGRWDWERSEAVWYRGL